MSTICCPRRMLRAKTLIWICSMSDTTFLLMSDEHDFVTRNMGKSMRGRLLEFDASAPAGVELTLMSRALWF